MKYEILNHLGVVIDVIEAISERDALTLYSYKTDLSFSFVMSIYTARQDQSTPPPSTK